jgi:hypothetical protein
VLLIFPRLRGHGFRLPSVPPVRSNVPDGGMDTLPDELDLEGMKEAFHWRIVPDISGPAHRAGDVVISHQPLKLIATVLGGFNRSSQHLRYYPD